MAKWGAANRENTHPEKQRKTPKNREKPRKALTSAWTEVNGRPAKTARTRIAVRRRGRVFGAVWGVGLRMGAESPDARGLGDPSRCTICEQALFERGAGRADLGLFI